MIEGGLTAVECWGAIDFSRHERRFRLLSNRVVPHPADPTLEEGAELGEWQQTHDTLNIEAQWGGLCNSAGQLQSKTVAPAVIRQEQ